MALFYIAIAVAIAIFLYANRCFRVPSPIFYTKQYVGHARHVGPYPENTIQLFRHLIDVFHYKIIEADVVFTSDGIPVLNHGINAIAYKGGVKHNVCIRELAYQDLLKYSVAEEEHIPFSSVEQYAALGKQRGVCIMLDLTFQTYSFKNLKCLYDIINKHGMEMRTIWGGVNVFKLALLNRNLICQVDGSWGWRMYMEATLKSLFCRQMIMSFAFYGGPIESFARYVRYGHLLGFIMKVATVNEKKIADRFWAIGTDLINTDTLENQLYE